MVKRAVEVESNFFSILGLENKREPKTKKKIICGDSTCYHICRAGSCGHRMPSAMAERAVPFQAAPKTP